MAKLFLDATKEMGSAVSSDNENDFVKAKYKYQLTVDSDDYVQMLKDLDEYAYKMDEREEADESSD